TGAQPPPRSRVRIELVSTPESGTSTALRARCAATPGIPTQVIDVVEASAFPFFDPLALGLSVRAPGLVTQLDACDSFGNAGPALRPGRPAPPAAPDPPPPPAPPPPPPRPPRKPAAAPGPRPPRPPAIAGGGPRAAGETRASDLRACEVPPGAPAQVPARLRL